MHTPRCHAALQRASPQRAARGLLRRVACSPSPSPGLPLPGASHRMLMLFLCDAERQGVEGEQTNCLPCANRTLCPRRSPLEDLRVLVSRGAMDR